MALSLGVGLYFTKRASSSLSEFFLSGRSLPWWLAGTSMAAASFAADTPLYVTGLVRGQGIYENWQWWCYILSGMLSVFFFARLWRRLGVLTDVQLIDLRYEGRSARILRGFKAVYFSFAIHTIIKAQIILAMAKILEVILGWGKWDGILVSSAIVLAYSTMAGYWGVVVTDFFQFIIAMTGAILLAVVSVHKAGGLPHIMAIVPASKLAFFPSPGKAAFMAFLGYIGLSWWSKYSSDGGGIIVQRMASSRDEKQSLLATFYFNVVTFAARTWPWVLAALASMVLYPVLKDNETAYPKMVLDLLPTGLKGLMLSAFFAAFMSSVGTYLNLSSAYMINDLYRPFIKPDASERHYLMLSRLITLVLAGVTALITYHVSSIVGVFKFLIAFGSGTGLVYIARWFWWRVNAWSEISAMMASTAVSAFVYENRLCAAMPFYDRLAAIIGVSTVIWIAVTLLTKPVSKEKLRAFYEKTLPGGPGWGDIRKGFEGRDGGNFSRPFYLWLLGSVFLVGLTMGIGKMIFGWYASGAAWLALSFAAALALWRGVKKGGIV
ncbi:MAG: Na+:solute symporter [Nitrospiraceae bacterium]|nr:Na+:solute symporter [Nitrospiraceae bacterium]